MSYIPRWKCWTVRKRKTKPNATGRKVFSRCTTKKNAKKQLRLLRAIQYDPNFRLSLRRNKTAKARPSKSHTTSIKKKRGGK